MFDAKSLIEMLMKGASPQASQGQAGGGLGDILGQLGGMVGNTSGQGAGPGPAQAGGGGGQMAGIEDMLRKLGVGVPSGQAAGQPSTQSSANATGGGGLGDILGQLQKQFGGAGMGGAAPGASAAPGAGGMGAAPGGSIMDVLGQILAQATSGVKEGAGRIDSATGASGHMRDALGKATGQSPDEILAKLKDLISNNQMATGAGLGGLGALVLGTRAGRSMAGSAVKLGALALIGGLAYKAYQNYSNGQPPLGAGQAFAHEAAPQGSGFEADAVSQESATIYIRAMIAAAAADGRIDADEQKKILGGLQSAGLTSHAQAFLEHELNNPATVEDLIASVKTPQEAMQVYTAARVAVDPDTRGEAMFLAQLAAGLGIDATLAAHIDAAARAA